MASKGKVKVRIGAIKKMFGIQTELVHLNLKEILDNYRDPKFWKRKWCVFKTKDFDCIWKMKSINVDENTITSDVTLEYKGKHNAKEYSWFFGSAIGYYCSTIPISHSDYTQETFSKNILGTVIQCIDLLERRIVKNSYEYKEAERLEEKEEDRLKETAEKFLDSENVTNRDIREAYIDSFVSKSRKYDYTSRIVNNCYRKYYPTARLLAYSWFDNKGKFDEEQAKVKEIKGKIKKKIIYEIWKSSKELEGDDFIAEAEEQLEAI